MLRRLALLIFAAFATPGFADEIKASDPVKLDITIYRDPYRDSGSIELQNLGGFAVITETRRVTIPAGKHRLRFEGVIDGIIPESAIITGLPGGVIEKNQNADLLSPSALLRAARGRKLTLTRTDPATGKPRRTAAEIVSASPEGVVFKTGQGFETLRCSGFPETFRYDASLSGVPARPTLSVLTRSSRPIEATVTLTYVAERFDWGANYTMHVNEDGETVDFGGWITLANGNSSSLDNARVHVVAGTLNREEYERLTGPDDKVVANCWAMQTTSDIPLKPDRPYQLVRPYRFTGYARANGDIVVTGERMRQPSLNSPTPISVFNSAELEQLGDLKLYRVPVPSTVAAQQMKQVRLLEVTGVKYDRIFIAKADLSTNEADSGWSNPVLYLRIRNDKAHGLGLPIPGGKYLIEQDQFGRTMVIDEVGGRDHAINEEITLQGPDNSDLSWRQLLLNEREDGKEIIRSYEIEVRNAGSKAAVFEAWPSGPPNLIRTTSLPLSEQNGRRIWRLTVPANGTMKFSFAAVLE